MTHVRFIPAGCLLLLAVFFSGCRRQQPPTTGEPSALTLTWHRLPALPDSSSLGVSAPFVGLTRGRLLVAGGCNFPDVPAAEGGTKRYYSEIFTLDLSDPDARWQPGGRLPRPVAYGASVTTPEGVVCLGGNNSDGSFTDVWLLTLSDSDETVQIRALSPLPSAMDNLAATYADRTIYVAGGNEDGAPGHSFYAMRPDNNPDGTWEKLPDVPGQVRLQPVMAALPSADGLRVYLSGGFQPVCKGADGEEKDAVVSSDVLSYHPATRRWSEEARLPLSADGTPRTFTGGCAVACGDSTLLLMGGVNHERFLTAINRSLYIRQAEERGEHQRAAELAEEGREYMYHPMEWYKFNTILLQYNTFTKEWTDLGNHGQLARAGAGAVLRGDSLIVVNGELKPGIRTPQVNCAVLRLGHR